MTDHDYKEKQSVIPVDKRVIEDRPIDPDPDLDGEAPIEEDANGR